MDEKALVLRSDGHLAGAFGFHLPGLGQASTGWGAEADLTAGWALMGVAELLTLKEAMKGYAALRKEARRAFLGLPHHPDGLTPERTRRIVFDAL